MSGGRRDGRRSETSRAAGGADPVPRQIEPPPPNAGAGPDAGAVEFESFSWHDCHIWGLELRVGEPEVQDWTSDLALRIDFILEWICGIGGGGQFRVAPAELVFHGVTDPRISITWGDGRGQQSLHLASIDRIERDLVADAKVFLDRPYYRWRILLNWPAGGEIAFGATDFTQTLLGPALLTDQQPLTRTERSRLLEK